MYRSMKSFKKAWVKALRAGEYQQGQNMLCRVGSHKDIPDSFCCLGVAADLLILNGHDLKWEENPNYPVSMRINTTAGTHPGKLSPIKAALPQWLQDWLTRKREARLITMNDDGKNFETIADWIESRD